MYEIIGIERVDYKNKEGRQITGWRLYFTYDPPRSDGFDGRMCDSCFCSDDVFAKSGVSVGEPAMPVYDKRGRCTGFLDSSV